jgi:ribosomal protein S18 acetylase RimI-like enzyme
VLPFFYRAAVRYAFDRGLVLGTAGAVRGAVIVLPPERPLLDGSALARAGLWQLPLRAGLRGFGRFLTQARGFRAHQESDVAPRHFYLWELGVEPEHQRRGIGGAMLRVVTAKSDAARAPVYVDTTDPRNLPLYGRHGFRVRHQAVFPSGGCRFWTLVRVPAVTSA